MEKDNPKYGTKLIYDRLQRGFNFYLKRLKDLFAFRLRKKEKQNIVDNAKNGLPFFGKLPFDNLFLEAVA